MGVRLVLLQYENMKDKKLDNQGGDGFSVLTLHWLTYRVSRKLNYHVSFGIEIITFDLAWENKKWVSVTD